MSRGYKTCRSCGAQNKNANTACEECDSDISERLSLKYRPKILTDKEKRAFHKEVDQIRFGKLKK